MFLLGWLMVESGLESDMKCKNGTFVWGWSFLFYFFFVVFSVLSFFFFFGGFFFSFRFFFFPPL